MFYHIHPYPPYILPNSKRLIVGTLPPPRFTTGELKKEDVDFCYGSSNGMLWKIWDELFDLKLRYENTAYSIQQRKAFLKSIRLAFVILLQRLIDKKSMLLIWEWSK